MQVGMHTFSNTHDKYWVSVSPYLILTDAEYFLVFSIIALWYNENYTHVLMML